MYIIYIYCIYQEVTLCIESNVTKCVVVVFRNEKTFDGEWFWGNSALPHLDYHNYLGVKITYNGHYIGMHILRIL